MPGVQCHTDAQSGVQCHTDAQLLEIFEEMTNDAQRVQDATLRKILGKNSSTEYLRRYGLDGRTADAATFRDTIPLIKYSEIANDIRRIADGEDGWPILTMEPVTMFALSSGTSKGKPKLIPMQDAFFMNTIRLFRIGASYRSRNCVLNSKGRVMDIVYCGKQFKTSGGVMVGTGTTNYFRSSAFQLKQESTMKFTTSPKEVIFCKKIHETTYCHLLFGLLYSGEVELITATFIYSIIDALRLLETMWKCIADDIRYGKLPDWITDRGIIKAASELLYPNPEIAQSIEQECSKGFYGILHRLWPNAKYVHSIMTGSMEPYLPKIRYYAGNLPLVAGDYGASESWIAINVNPMSPPEETSFTIVPDLAYFEFIPLRRSTTSKSASAATMYEESQPVRLCDVEVGGNYEIVLTTFAGLYRYRLGDVVRITGFFNSCPQFKYVCRKDVVLSIHIDKNSEKDLQVVVEKATRLLAAKEKDLGIEISDYTSYADMSFPGHYVIFWELTTTTAAAAVEKKNKWRYDAVIQDCCNQMDKAFVDPGYVVSRAAHTIGALELRIVKKGTFSKMIRHSIGIGGTLSQFKAPRCVNSPALLDILEEGLVSTYFSTHV